MNILILILPIHEQGISLFNYFHQCFITFSVPIFHHLVKIMLSILYFCEIVNEISVFLFWIVPYTCLKVQLIFVHWFCILQLNQICFSGAIMDSIEFSTYMSSENRNSFTSFLLICMHLLFPWLTGLAKIILNQGMKVGILVLFLTLEEKLIAFHHWLWSKR